MLVYRLLLCLIAGPVALMLLWRAVRGRETWRDLRQRMGRGEPIPAQGPVIWVHGASNGELTSAWPLLQALLAARSDIYLVVTTNTVTGRALAAKWGHDRLIPRLAPLDLRWCLWGFLRAARPQGVLTLENEVWPNRLRMAHRRRLPVAWVGARLSAKSARRWRQAPRLARRLMAPVWSITPQSTADADRFAQFELPPGGLSDPVMLKAAVTLPAPDPEILGSLAPQFHRTATVLAASTHPGEEEPLIEAFVSARKRRPGLRLILAPRHPQRGAEVSAMLEYAGLSHARRGLGEAPAPLDPVYLADTMGEMSLWYTLAGLCFVGGSLVPKGGHTPYEPAAYGCAILHGPDTANFTEAYHSLHAAKAALGVATAAELGDAIGRLTTEQVKAMGEHGRTTLGSEAAMDGIRALVPRLLFIFGVDGPRA